MYIEIWSSTEKESQTYILRRKLSFWFIFYNWIKDTISLSLFFFFFSSMIESVEKKKEVTKKMERKTPNYWDIKSTEDQNVLSSSWRGSFFVLFIWYSHSWPSCFYIHCCIFFQFYFPSNFKFRLIAWLLNLGQALPMASL